MLLFTLQRSLSHDSADTYLWFTMNLSLGLACRSWSLFVDSPVGAFDLCQRRKTNIFIFLRSTI